MRGARQVGKSHLVRTWGARFGRVVELNQERDPAIARCFSDNDPRATLGRLEVVARAHIPTDGSVLLFLDEIQTEPAVLAKLRWFAEELPSLPLVCAGSLLDFALREPTFSMPVGRVGFMHLEPMGFCEFMEALGEERLTALTTGLSIDDLQTERSPLAPFHERLMDLFRQSLGLSLSGIDAGADLMLAHRGALAEQVVGQLLRLGLRAHEEPALYFWHREATGSEAELDYVTQQGARVVPIEVKAGATGSRVSTFS